MPRMKYNPHIIVLDNAIWRTHDKDGNPLKPSSGKYYPTDADIEKMQKQREANSAESSAKSDE